MSRCGERPADSGLGGQVRVKGEAGLAHGNLTLQGQPCVCVCVCECRYIYRYGHNSISLYGLLDSRPYTFRLDSS